MFALSKLKTVFSLGSLAPKASTPLIVHSAGFQKYPVPKNYDHITIPEKPKLRLMLKAPNFNCVKAPKMQKRLMLMRGPEMEHNKQLIHKQYGIIALQGGRIKHQHIEIARLHIGKKMDTKRMFAIWRFADPWQPLTKKGIGVRMGAGKGAIHSYCTPIREGRVLLEVGGKCEFGEVKPFLDHVAACFPFKAMAVSQEMLEKMERKKDEGKRKNLNPFTKQYTIQNNMFGCHRWLRRVDHKWFGEHI